jgi:hypothetical protein
MAFRRIAALLSLLLTAPLLHAQFAGLRDAPEPNEAIQKEGGWVHTIQYNLVTEHFTDLEAMAAKYRANKARLPGGGWRLHEFYVALESPQLTDKSSEDHLDHLRHWISAYPTSITPRVAYAISLHRWAWVARGSGSADSVTPDGWKQFNDRIAESEKTLADAATLKTKDPQWYSEMMTVALAESWPADKTRALFEEGIAFEPKYFYLYRQYANDLLPKWNGEPLQASTFAKTSADRVGGDAGDELYFQIATELISRHNSRFNVRELDWQRIQHGYTVLAADFGVTRTQENQLAFMAYKYKDVATAQRQFATIGDKWSRTIWLQRDFFDKIRDWAQSAPTPLGPPTPTTN